MLVQDGNLTYYLIEATSEETKKFRPVWLLVYKGVKVGLIKWHNGPEHFDVVIEYGPDTKKTFDDIHRAARFLIKNMAIPVT
jgi:hypothetical protein